MACSIVPKVAITFTCTGTGVNTTTSTFNMYVGQIGWVTGNGQPTKRIINTEVRIDNTTFTARFFPESNDPATTKTAYSGNSQPSDLSAYSGGTIFYDEQVVRTS